MGFNSVVFICNDAIDQIDKDPRGWWQKTKQELVKVLHTEPQTREYGFGCHANGFRAVWNGHADRQALIAVGGNYATVIWSGHRGNAGHNTRDQQLDLLQAAAAEMGMDLRPARPPPIRPEKPPTAKEREADRHRYIQDLRAQLRALEEG